MSSRNTNNSPRVVKNAPKLVRLPLLHKNSIPFKDFGNESQESGMQNQRSEMHEETETSDKSPFTRTSRSRSIKKSKPVKARAKSRPQKFNNKNLNSLEAKIDYYISPYNKEPMVHKYLDFGRPNADELVIPVMTPQVEDLTKLGQEKWRKISRLICDPKKKSMFTSTLNMVRSAYHENIRKRREMEERLLRERLAYIKRERERAELNRKKKMENAKRQKDFVKRMSQVVKFTPALKAIQARHLSEISEIVSYSGANSVKNSELFLVPEGSGSFDVREQRAKRNRLHCSSLGTSASKLSVIHQNEELVKQEPKFELKNFYKIKSKKKLSPTTSRLSLKNKSPLSRTSNFKVQPQSVLAKYPKLPEVKLESLANMRMKFRNQLEGFKKGMSKSILHDLQARKQSL